MSNDLIERLREGCTNHAFCGGCQDERSDAADEITGLREALKQSAIDLSVASGEILNLVTHSERGRIAADRVAEFCHSQAKLARVALPTEGARAEGGGDD